MTESSRPTSRFWAFDRITPGRSLALSAVGAVIGLLVAGFGLFTAQGTRTLAIPPENAAVVNSVPVLMTDLITQLRLSYGVSLDQATPAQKRKILDDMIREELYVQRGIELGLANDDSDVRQALVSSAESVVAQEALSEQPSEAELTAWYAKHPDAYSSEGLMTLREYVVPAGSATAVVAALRAGKSPQTLGSKSSGRVDDGEEYYFAARIHLGDAVFAAARALKDGQVSDPVARPDGAHILMMVQNVTPQRVPYAEARDKVRSDLLAAKVARLHTSNERFLRRRADIKIARGLE